MELQLYDISASLLSFTDGAKFANVFFFLAVSNLLANDVSKCNIFLMIIYGLDKMLLICTLLCMLFGFSENWHPW